MKKAEITGIAPRIYVENVTETRNFYIDQLGFTLINELPGLYAMVQRNGFQVHFAVFHHKYPNRRQVQHFILWVPEIDIFFDEICSKNVTITEPIQKRVYGSREFVIEDNNGNSITIAD